MTRIVDATLTAALAAGTGIPFIKGFIGYTNGTVIYSGAVTGYKLTGTTLEFEIPYIGDLGGVSAAIWLERGVTIAGTKYSITTGRFRILSQHYQANGRQLIKGALFPKAYYAAAADVTYKTVIDAFCTAYGKTAVYKDPAAAWLNYKFFPAGKTLILNDPNSFANLLRQKWLIFYCDNGSEEVLFYSCDGSLAGAPDFTITATDDVYMETVTTKNRYLMWRDEAGTIHYSGTATDPIHNLGYLESTAAAPARKSPGVLMEAVTRPDLRIMDGDIVAVSAIEVSTACFALIREEYAAPDKSHKAPRWTTTVESNEVFGNTAGGALPSTIERVSNYTPLNTSMFTNVLASTDNNLQAAMDKLDDHRHPFIIAAQGLSTTILAGATMFTPPFYYGLNVSGFNFVLPVAGTLKKLAAKLTGAQPATGTLVCVVTVNNTDTALTFTVPANGGTGTYTDATHTVAVNANDVCCIKFVNNAAAASIAIGAVGLIFLPYQP